MLELFEPVITGKAFAWRDAVVARLPAFGLGQTIAGVYMATFRGLSNARTAVHGMALGSVMTHRTTWRPGRASAVRTTRARGVRLPLVLRGAPELHFFNVLVRLNR